MEQQSQRDIALEHKAAFVVGSALALVGFLLILSVSMTGEMTVGSFDRLEVHGRFALIRWIVGVVLTIAGGAVAPIFKVGLPASGMNLHSVQGKVQCRVCGALNDDEARFCDQCGQAL